MRGAKPAPAAPPTDPASTARAPLRTTGGFDNERGLADLHSAALRDYQQRLAGLTATTREVIRAAVPR